MQEGQEGSRGVWGYTEESVMPQAQEALLWDDLQLDRAEGAARPCLPFFFPGCGRRFLQASPFHFPFGAHIYPPTPSTASTWGSLRLPSGRGSLGTWVAPAWQSGVRGRESAPGASGRCLEGLEETWGPLAPTEQYFRTFCSPGLELATPPLKLSWFQMCLQDPRLRSPLTRQPVHCGFLTINVSPSVM